MKFKTLLLAAIVAAGIVSCDKKADPAKAKADSLAKIEKAKQDSIVSAEKAEAAEAKQDSIEASQIKGYAIKKVSGKFKYDGSNKLEYKSLYDAIEEAKSNAKKEMWTDEKLNATIANYKEMAKGGIITLHIERSTIGSADLKYFTIIVNDSSDKEVYRETFDSSVADYYGDIWWNIGSIYVPERTKAPFYIYVVDKLEDEPFKYEVTPIKK